MRGDHLADDHHVLRYCSPSRLGANNLPLPTAFYPKDGEVYLSVNWVEFYAGDECDEAVRKIRKCLSEKMVVKPNGGLACLEVEAIKRVVGELPEENPEVTHQPCADDPSHAGVFGVPPEGPQMMMVAMALSELACPEDVLSAMS